MIFGSEKIDYLENIAVDDLTLPINNIDFINTNTIWVIGENK